jgi:hypothetical protein
LKGLNLWRSDAFFMRGISGCQQEKAIILGLTAIQDKRIHRQMLHILEKKNAVGVEVCVM